MRNPLRRFERDARSLVDDLGMDRGVVPSRAAASLRSAETKPFDPRDLPAPQTGESSHTWTEMCWVIFFMPFLPSTETCRPLLGAAGDRTVTAPSPNRLQAVKGGGGEDRDPASPAAESGPGEDKVPRTHTKRERERQRETERDRERRREREGERGRRSRPRQEGNGLSSSRARPAGGFERTARPRTPTAGKGRLFPGSGCCGGAESPPDGRGDGTRLQAVTPRSWTVGLSPDPGRSSREGKKNHMS